MHIYIQCEKGENDLNPYIHAHNTHIEGLWFVQKVIGVVRGSLIGSYKILSHYFRLQECNSFLNSV